MKGRCKYIVSALMGIALFGFADVQADLKVPPSPAMRKATGPNSVQKIKNAAVIGAPKILSSRLIIDAPPYGTHCRDRVTENFSGRVEVKVELPNHPVPSMNEAVLVVNTGSGEATKGIMIAGGKGNAATVASNNLRFDWPEDCNNSCVEYRIEGIKFDVATNIRTGNLKACVKAPEL